MKLRNITLKNVHCAAPEATLMDIATMMRNYDVGVIPVCEGKKVLGLVTDRNIAVSCIASDLSGSTCLAKDYMITHAPPVNLDTDVEEAARLMAVDKVTYLPVVDHGEIAGIVSLGDIALALRDNDRLVAETLRYISETG